MLKVNIAKSKRKTLTLTVDINGNIVVKSPIGLDDTFINEWIRSKTSWIKNKLSSIASRKIYYYGKPYPIEFISTTKNIVDFKDEKFVIAQDFENKHIFHINKWLRREANRYITKRIKEVSLITGLKFNKLTIKDTKTRWGSCSYHNNININWRVITMDTELIDYILIHELCHTIVKDHSANFWKLVRKFIPNLNTVRLKLKSFEKTQIL